MSMSCSSEKCRGITKEFSIIELYQKTKTSLGTLLTRDVSLVFIRLHGKLQDPIEFNRMKWQGSVSERKFSDITIFSVSAYFLGSHTDTKAYINASFH